jgi:oligopeptide/dipeptide ABC transporter ATP-binding protein
MIDLKNEFGLSYLFISHDLSVVRHISNRIAVMYLGKIVEIGTAEQVCDEPLHPYSRALLSAVPSTVRKKKTSRIILEGDVPSPSNPPSGCTFHTRCPIARPECSVNEPQLLEKKPGRLVRCPYV